MNFISYIISFFLIHIASIYPSWKCSLPSLGTVSQLSLGVVTKVVSVLHKCASTHTTSVHGGNVGNRDVAFWKAMSQLPLCANNRQCCSGWLPLCANRIKSSPENPCRSFHGHCRNCRPLKGHCTRVVHCRLYQNVKGVVLSLIKFHWNISQVFRALSHSLKGY